MKNFTLFAAFILVGFLANADEIDSAHKICNKKIDQDFTLEICRAVKLLPAELTAAQIVKIQDLAETSTDSWPDSVLEGDVDTNFEGFEINSIHQVIDTQTNQLLGYQLRFSYAGWETSCAKDNYDREKPETYASCEKGKITQTIFISSDLKDYELLTFADLEISDKK